MSSEKMPDVEKQVAQYKRLFDAVGAKKIIFRSLDVGSDKFLPYWGEMKEDNPAIGWRSIRITLDRRAILRQQMRAMLRAAAGKELNVMFPMISTLQEFTDAKETLMLEYEREKQRGNPTAKNVKVGIMIEVPSVLFQLDDIYQHVDFVSVGTNDLYQFVFACDRGNPRLSERYDVLSAPFLKLMKLIVDKANQYKVYCSVCGEMAGNPLEAMALIGLGYRNLSVSGASYAAVKKMINSMNEEDVEDYVKTLLKSSKTSVFLPLSPLARKRSCSISSLENEAQTVGEIIRNARLKQGRTINDAAEELCIRKAYVEAIETMDLSKMPQMPYALGFVRSYADYLGLNSNRIVFLYRKAIMGDTAEEDENIQNEEPSVPNLKHLLFAFIGLIIVFAIWSSWPIFEYVRRKCRSPRGNGCV